MNSIKEISIEEKHFLNKLTIIYGESESGKSFITRNIMYELRNKIPQVFVICPSEPTNGSYGGGRPPLVKQPCILYDLTEDWLEKFWDRQEGHTAIYERANKPEHLRSVCMKVQGMQQRAAKFEAAKSKHIEMANKEYTGEEARAKIKEIEIKAEEYMQCFYKSTIVNNIEYLKKIRGSLTEDEIYCVDFVNFNPHVLLILDDVSESLKNVLASKVGIKLATKGRHALISTVIATHDDKFLSTETRKQAHNVIWTVRAMAATYLSKGTNGAIMTKGAIDGLLGEVFSKGDGPAKYQKLWYIRGNNEYYRFTARAVPTFSFGAPIVNKFCDAIEISGSTKPQNNKFYEGLVKK